MRDLQMVQNGPTALKEGAGRSHHQRRANNAALSDVFVKTLPPICAQSVILARRDGVGRRKRRAVLAWPSQICGLTRRIVRFQRKRLMHAQRHARPLSEELSHR